MRDTYGTRSLREIVRIIFERWVMIAAIVIVFGGGTLLYCTAYARPVYRSQVGLIFKRPQNNSPVSADSQERALEVFVKAQQQIVLSDLVLARAMAIARDDGLRGQWLVLRDRLEAAEDAGGDVAGVHKAIDAFVTENADRPGTVAHIARRLLAEDQDELRKFRRSVELETPGGEQVALTESFTIVVDQPAGPGPEGHRAAEYAADAVADMYMVRHRQLQQALNEPAVHVMASVVETMRRSMDQRRQAHEAFVADNAGDIGVLEQLLKSGTEHGTQIVLTKVREEDAKLQLDLARVRAMRDVIIADLPPAALEPSGVEEMPNAEVAAAVATVPAELLEANVIVRTLKQRETELVGERAKLESQFTSEARSVRYLNEEIRRVQRELLRSIAAHAHGLSATVRAYEQQQAKNRELIAGLTDERNTITRKLSAYVRLKNDLETAHRQVAELEDRKVAAETSSLQAREAVTISKLDAPRVPDANRPVAPRTALYTTVAFAVGTLLSMALAFLADHFDHSLRSTEEAERQLGVPVLGTVKKRGRGILVATADTA